MIPYNFNKKENKSKSVRSMKVYNLLDLENQNPFIDI